LWLGDLGRSPLHFCFFSTTPPREFFCQRTPPPSGDFSVRTNSFSFHLPANIVGRNILHPYLAHYIPIPSLLGTHSFPLPYLSATSFNRQPSLPSVFTPSHKPEMRSVPPRRLPFSFEWVMPVPTENRACPGLHSIFLRRSLLRWSLPPLKI